MFLPDRLISSKLVNKLTQGDLDRVLDRNVVALFPGIHMTFLVVSVSKKR